MPRSDNSIRVALDSAFEMSVGPGLYVLDSVRHSNASCKPDFLGSNCNSTYGIASGPVDVDSELSGRNNVFPRGLYNAPPIPSRQVELKRVDVGMEPTLYKFKGSLRGLEDGPALERIGKEWLPGVDIQDTRHIVHEEAGLSRHGKDARLYAKDSVLRG